MFNGEVENVFTACVAEGDELLVPFYAGWVDGADVVVTDTFTDVP